MGRSPAAVFLGLLLVGMIAVFLNTSSDRSGANLADNILGFVTVWAPVLVLIPTLILALVAFLSISDARSARTRGQQHAFGVRTKDWATRLAAFLDSQIDPTKGDSQWLAIPKDRALPFIDEGTVIAMTGEEVNGHLADAVKDCRDELWVIIQDKSSLGEVAAAGVRLRSKLSRVAAMGTAVMAQQS